MIYDILLYHRHTILTTYLQLPSFPQHSTLMRLMAGMTRLQRDRGNRSSLYEVNIWMPVPAPLWCGH